MPNINDWLNNILTARYGEEVRGSIYNSIKLFNETLNNTSSQFNKDAAAVKESITVAQQAATTAQTAATTATTAKTAAETAKTAAETAKTGAEKAKTDARAYADITAGYVNEANTAATRAEAARDDTIEAKDVSVAAILQQQAESAQAVINTGNTVKDEITAKTTESVNAVKTQETASKAAVTAAGDEVAGAITAKTTEAVAAVGTAEADALQKIGDAADDIISGGDSVYVKKTGDTITGIVKAPAPLENADDGQLATVGFVKSNSTKNAVTKEGTSVVIGDIQVPDPETESSVVPRGYVEKGFLRNNSANSYNIDTGHKLLADAGPIDFYGMNPSYVVCSSTFLIQGYTRNVNSKDFGILRFAFDSRKEPNMLLVWNYCGPAINPSDFLILHKIENNQLHLKVVYTQNINYRGIKLVCLSSQQGDRDNKDIPWTFYSNGRLDELPSDFTLTASTIGNLKTGEIFSEVETPSAANSLIRKDYADSVPYQYAKAAFFPFNETVFKRDLSYMGIIFARNFANTTVAGFIKLAESKNPVGSSALSTLVIEGRLSAWGTNNLFRMAVNNSPSDTDLNVAFSGIGKSHMNSIPYTIVVYKNSNNKIEIYFVSNATSNAWGVASLYISEPAHLNQWTINEEAINLDDSFFTSGTIPGTKVWDLKTAWGSTSRTQITKEEADNTYFKKTKPVTLQPRTTGYFAEPVQFLTPNNNGTTAARAYLWGQYNSTDNEAIFYLAGTDANGKGYNRIRMSNLKAPKVDSDAVPYDFLKTYVAANAGGFEPAKNAGAHNSIYRGKSLGATITSAQLTAIKNGTFDDLYIGDYWTSSNVNYRIAEFDYNPGSKHNIVLIPDQPLMSASYFPGGKKNTDSWTKNMCANFTPPNIPTSLVANTNVKSFEVMQGQNWRPLTGEFAYVEWVSKKAWFPSEQQIFGNEVYSHFHGIESALFLTAQEGYAYETDSQFALFRLNPNLIASTNGNPYWLCDTYPVKNASNYHTYGIKVNYGTRLCEQIYDAADNLTSSVTAYLRPYYVIEPV